MAYNSKLFPLTAFDNRATMSYPVAVFDNNRKLIGYADTPADVVTLWNGSAVNTVLGTIKATTDDFIFEFSSPSNKSIYRILAPSYTQISASITTIGTSYMATFGQSAPYFHTKLKDYWLKTTPGYNSDSDNNGKVSHDRTKRVHELINGNAYANSLFFHWGINDILYQDISTDPDAFTKSLLKVAGSHYAALANCFSGTYNCFVDAPLKTNTTNFTDTDRVRGSKCSMFTKNILSLTDANSYVEFPASGKTNITYFVSDGISADLGQFDIYVDGVYDRTIETNNQTVDLTGLNNTIATEGDYFVSPNSVVLNLSIDPHIIRIQNVSALPVWLDYYSDIITDLDKGAKPVYAANIPSFIDGEVIYTRWTIFNASVEAVNAKLKEVYDFWQRELGAPVALADIYTGFNPLTMYADHLHWSQVGSDFVLDRFNIAVKNLFKEKIVV